MKINVEKNWKTNNNGYPLNDEEVERYNSVLPSERQLANAEKPFYAFIHFGMNTATGREWGNALETCADFTITKFKPQQWVKAIRASGATGIILTCKHHDGFCLWDTRATDFNVMNTALATDIVKGVSDECHKQGIDFGVYLSPWDMHEKTYATEAYNDFFCTQLTELLTNYGEVFEVWFDGAKGAGVKDFEYAWERYYEIVRTLQPKANISICGPDLRWVGNEGGVARKSEFSVVPKYLTECEKIQKNSQKTIEGADALQKITSRDEDLGSRKVLSKNEYLCWYPAEVDVSMHKGWFYHEKDKVKSVSKLFDIYLNSVGGNCSLLLNVPPSNKGVIDRRDVNRLKALGRKINSVTANPVYVHTNFENMRDDEYSMFTFDSVSKLKYCVLKEDISKGQRIEKFDLYIIKPNGKPRRVCNGTVIGARKIIKINRKARGAVLVIRQSRSTPMLKELGFYG